MKCKLTLLLTILICSCQQSLSTFDLKCECLNEPVGINTLIPSFSWKIKSSNGTNQVAYQIQVASSKEKLINGETDLWESGQVMSANQLFVKYEGKDLSSRQICYWRVRIWESDKKISEWSEPQFFSIGILPPDTFKGEYIGYMSEGSNSPFLRKTFNIEDTNIENAIMHINSLGYHELYINGHKISDNVLTPAVSELSKRSLIVSYDVSKFLQKGENDILIWIAQGWYRNITFNAQYEGALVRADLDINGVTCVTTDGSWCGCNSGYRTLGKWKYGDFGGEKIDARYVPGSFDSKCLNSLQWGNVEVAKIDNIEATPQMCEPCTIQEIVTAINVSPNGQDSWIVDMGKVLNGFAEIYLPQLPEGHITKVSYMDGIYDENKNKGNVSSDILISSGKEGGDTFTNKFNHHVFRFITIDSLPVKPDFSKIKGLRIRTNYDRIASFECSDTNMNKIHDMITYTMENLAFDGYMVDCANRERLGYGGDGNASTLSIQTVFNVNALYRNWLQAWNDVIHEDGGLPHTAPSPDRAGGGPYWCSFIVQAPWKTFMNYGDDRMLKECYPNMKLWLKYVDSWSKDGLLYPWPETEYRGWYLGDWVAPDGTDYQDPVSVDLVNNCTLSLCYQQLVQIAKYLGEENDCKDFATRKETINSKIHEKFYHAEDSTYGTGSQLDMIFPLLVEAVPNDLVNGVKEKLNDINQNRYKNHIGGGLVGIPILAEWSTKSKSVEMVYNMLSQSDYPGYLYMMGRGATSTWEYWDGSYSRMHNTYNGICSWFYQSVGGIIPLDPGYRTISIDPQIPSGITWARVSEKIPFGEIEVYWEKRNDKVEMDITIPVGVTAIINDETYPCGTYHISI